jgi:hypothetical protein
MTEHEHDENIEDLDVSEEESADVKGGLLPAVKDGLLPAVQGNLKTGLADGSVLKINPGGFQHK